MSSAELLALWEQGLGQPTVRRALLLWSAFTGQPIRELAQLSVGQRDAQLLELRARIFGPQLTSLATCPACGERLELRINIHELRARTTSECGPIQVLQHEEYEATFRLPTSLDLAELRADWDAAVNRNRLIELCVVSARRGETEVPVSQLPQATLGAIAQRMAEADPYADIQFTTTCPQCRHQWSALLDIASFLWREIETLAQRLLSEVHLLAATYGWSETEILALSPARRQCYLSLIPR
ncbi:MAG: hypothetical protein L0Z50_02270 [Verrucomicrobiales bacterium]|nr:hypothetical protein [Verrucomicrobiales bacterium]